MSAAGTIERNIYLSIKQKHRLICLMISLITWLPPAPDVAAQISGRAIDSVVIRENRIATPFSQSSRNIEILSAETIRQLPVKTVSELLAYLGGVDLRQRGPWSAQADVGIDGSSFDQVLVLLNGVRMSDPQTGHHLLNLPIPLSAIDHIEVLHGPAARVYGVNALAGSINIITRIPADEIGVQAYAGSSFNRDTGNGETFYGYGAQLHGAWQTKGTSQLLSASRDAGNGYRYNTAFATSKVYYENRVSMSTRNTLTAAGGYIHNQFGAGLFYAAPADKEATETVQTAFGAISLQSKLSAKLTITPRISVRYNKDDYIYIRQRPEVYRNVHESGTANAEVHAAYTLPHGTIGAGLEYRHEQLTSTNLGRHDRDNRGLFAEYRHRFGSRATLAGGLYANGNSDWGWQVYPGIDAAVFIGQGWKAFVNASTGQRLPTYTDLYYKSPTNIGNAELRPEEAGYLEGGVRYARAAVSTQVSTFIRRTTNLIDWVRSDELQPWQPQNFAQVSTRGITGLADVSFDKLLRLPAGTALDLHLAYTYLDASLDDASQPFTKYSASLLRHQLIARVSAGQGPLRMSINARYNYRLPGLDYTLLDARLAWNFRSGQIYAEGTNLLNTPYVEAGAVPMPGRWLALGARYSWHP